MLSAIASIFGIEGEKETPEKSAQRLVDQVVDPAGTFYRFSLPASLLRRRRIAQTGGEK